MNKLLYVDEQTRELLSSLRAEREKKKLTQKDIGDIVGVKTTTISAYERKKITPTLEVFLKLAMLFEWDISGNVN